MFKPISIEEFMKKKIDQHSMFIISIELLVEPLCGIPRSANYHKTGDIRLHV